MSVSTITTDIGHIKTAIATSQAVVFAINKHPRYQATDNPVAAHLVEATGEIQAAIASLESALMYLNDELEATL